MSSTVWVSTWELCQFKIGTNMKGYFVLFLTVSFCFGGQLKKRENFWYITGKGCGISTELKYLTEIPENHEEMLRCSDAGQVQRSTPGLQRGARALKRHHQDDPKMVASGPDSLIGLRSTSRAIITYLCLSCSK